MAKKKPLAMHVASRIRRETFEGIPIVDAKADMELLLRTSDIKRAKGHRKDPLNCALAMACAKHLGASKVAFLRRIAYLELPDAHGNKRMVRYKLGADAAAVVEAFDKGKSIRGEVTVLLKAPSKSETLDSIRKRSQQVRERQRQALLKGKLIDPNPSRSRYTRKPISGLDVRNGQGMFHSVLQK